MRRIKSLPLSLRPREKLLKSGTAALTTEELISTILVTGTRNQDVGKIASQIAARLRKQQPITKETLLVLGIGPAKTAQVLAVLELDKRLDKENKVLKITKAEHVYTLAQDIISATKESLLCFYLNARGELLKKETVAVGSLNRVNLLPREIFSVIKDMPVASIILVHNHPSGDLEPSRNDLLFTKRVKQAGDILGVNLLDHLIVSLAGWKRIKI
ncbi:MAG: repair protein RadC protein [Candidatus Gottesmanbacteria bacterium GW2011_GWB1_43_11]|uniref:Repair protein RadC protein n=1 Tax=Candidatus Gottesmanbacteria bacterium GW2011_GWB1_43_11 TaxID=1618446 RepID=A0A0G1FLB7_9BACT|nr:MAG: repair protein RadC protein [Candidatus Gottesmanbacteria bacterium GW2011_GWA2_42_16]KKS56065.1 MAG: repair protein RadC protein [Candidatus Gottesmanbacteria bacterium GW2011_GWA1_42_26]KKS81624.1 MAG: repair protein RadC protein [Candidatus Gottesmanbacteria bacterium GW2011_GWC1_43_10]KKS87693.1 MAG: repair protein RadC protein [Candidatus Gottesmanbacteria bacterium GW2011_GWB1_43_11]OGG07507.1 MAG: hypothetical protein A2699_00475 [Candidatus Gottesmanbacteria bacterium RIFCSPHIGH